MRIDLHCHSNHSDGTLSGTELIQLAMSRNIQLLSITDHDNIDVYHEIRQINTPIKIISGIEFSTSWNKIGIHIVGLNFNLDSQAMKSAIASQSSARKERAKIIAKRLEKCGLMNAYEKLRNTEKKQIGRPDFAQLLVDESICKDQTQAFKKYLGAGKIGDVKNQWLTLKEIVKVIQQASGIAVLAHPLYYKMTNSKLNQLLKAFKQCGGGGLEIVNGYQNPNKTDYLNNLANKYDLLASIGSDFHNPGQWKKLGCDTDWLTTTNVIWNEFR